MEFDILATPKHNLIRRCASPCWKSPGGTGTPGVFHSSSRWRPWTQKPGRWKRGWAPSIPQEGCQQTLLQTPAQDGSEAVHFSPSLCSCELPCALQVDSLFVKPAQNQLFVAAVCKQLWRYTHRYCDCLQSTATWCLLLFIRIFLFVT